MSNEIQPQRHIMVVSGTKSMGISILLTFLFGPLGMLYSTIPGAIVMIALNVIILILGVFTFGIGYLLFLLTWPICIIWGAVATNSYNKKLLAGTTVPATSSVIMDRTAQVAELPSGSVFDVGGEQKKCPACAEQIKLEALKCKHCGEILDPDAVRIEIERRKADLEQRQAERSKLLEGEIYYSEGWWRIPPGGAPVGPFKTRDEAATRIGGDSGAPSPEVPASFGPIIQAAALVAEPPPKDTDASEMATLRPPAQNELLGPSVSIIDAPQPSVGRKPWIIGGAAAVLLGLGSFAWFQLGRPRYTSNLVAEDGTRARREGVYSGTSNETGSATATAELIPGGSTEPARAKFLGEWYAVPLVPNPPTPDLYLKITRRGADVAELREGWESNGRKHWNEQNNVVRLRPLDDRRLAGRVRSHNFRATHGSQFDYTLTLETMPNGELEYTVISSLGKEIWKATRTQPSKPPHAANPTPSEVLKRFVGTWTDKDGRFLVDIGLSKNKIRIRECSATGATAGTEFFAKYSNDKIIAIGNSQDFYKFQFPSFKPLETGELLHDCGACGPDKLRRTTTPMPKIPYTPPVNND